MGVVREERRFLLYRRKPIWQETRVVRAVLGEATNPDHGGTGVTEVAAGGDSCLVVFD